LHVDVGLGLALSGVEGSRICAVPDLGCARVALCTNSMSVTWLALLPAGGIASDLMLLVYAMPWEWHGGLFPAQHGK
jgi:hypothetical protein